jgi:hypothetical protein
LWAKTGLLYPVPDPGFREQKAADPWAGRVGYKKLNKSCVAAASPKFMRLLCCEHLSSDPPTPVLLAKHCSLSMCTLCTYASVSLINTALHRLPYSYT